MKKCLIIIAASCICLAILFSAQAADGPAKNEKPAAPAGEVKAEKPAVEVISVTIHPAAAPKPALKYHLLPTFLESEPGNAVPCYLKALIRHVEIWRQLCDTPPSGEKCDLDLVDEWLTSRQAAARSCAKTR
jgi:hypothetical protein